MISITTQDATAVLTIDRPDKLNVLDRAMIDTLSEALNDSETDSRIRAIILTGAGDRAFSAGADITELAILMRDSHASVMREFVRRGQALTRRIELLQKPVIVAVNGLAYGGGCEIAEAASLAVASEHATFAKAEVKLGFAPPFGGSQRLPRLVGRKRALQMLLTGQPVTAREAWRIGLVNDVVPHRKLLERALELAQTIADKSPLAIAACLGAVAHGINVSLDEALAIEASYFERMLPTRDFVEGIGAWLERRPAEFVGR